MPNTLSLRLSAAVIMTSLFIIPSYIAATQSLPARAQILSKMKLANDYFMAKWPDPCKNCLTGNRPSNIWTRAVYYEGALAYARIALDTAAFNHAVRWGTFHDWNFRNGATTTNADDQCAGQCYIELFQSDNRPERIANVKTCINHMLISASNAHWTWIDAIHMAMPVFAKLGAIDGTDSHFAGMDALFNFTRSTLGLYNETYHLWWRDTTFKQAKTPAGKNIYWSRGNGWVFAALARVLDVLPAADPRYNNYVVIFTDMAGAIKAVQRSDGFWNENLADPAHFGGPEVTGTGLFTYGIAWGINRGLLDKDDYFSPVVRAWNAIADSAVFPNGALDYVQGTGDSPGDNGAGITNVTPSRNMVPDFDDFGLGCVLLAGSQMVRLADGLTALEVRHRAGSVTKNPATAAVRRCLNPFTFSMPPSGSEGRPVSIYDLSGKNIGKMIAAASASSPIFASTSNGMFILDRSVGRER